MTAEINELFEEGITRSRELADAVDEAMKAVDAATEQAKELATRVHDEGEEARGHLRGLSARLERAEGDLQTARDTAGTSLQELENGAGELESRSEELKEGIVQGMDELDQQRSRLDDSLDALMASAQGDVTELGERMQAVDAEATERLEEAGQAVEALRNAVDAARAAFGQKMDEWSAAAGTLETGAQEQTTAWLAGLQALVSRQAEAMVNAANALIDHHNATMESIKQELAREAPERFSTALDPLREELEELGREAEARGQALAGGVDGISQAAGRLPSPVAELTTALESTSELG